MARSKLLIQSIHITFIIVPQLFLLGAGFHIGYSLDMNTPHTPLTRAVGLKSAILLGLGSIFGTGVFVSLSIAAGVTGASVIAAIAVAALLATCNALSSAQLAAAYPVSGGTYEYGYRLLGPIFGFSAGWMFLVAKSASAATAALGVMLYVSQALGVPNLAGTQYMTMIVVIVMTGLVASGIRRSNVINTLIVGFTLTALLVFIAYSVLQFDPTTPANFTPIFAQDEHVGVPFLYASALMFVAFTGYGRMATLGEEVTRPEVTIPRAIIITLWISSVVYIATAIALIGTLGADAFIDTDPSQLPSLHSAAAKFSSPSLTTLIAFGAVTAMLGVVLNLILGLSRVALAMSRRGDLPMRLSKVTSGGSPVRAVVTVGVVILGLTMIGDIKTTWSLSALTVLIYYSVTNLAALRQPVSERLYPRWVSLCGLIGCLALTVFIPFHVWIMGGGILLVGWIYRSIFHRIARETV